jgi:hypothetical protein
MAKFRRKQVWEWAKGHCEYCLLSQKYSVLPHEIDHIRAKKHRGAHSLENTCIACAHCNAAKGSNAAGYDPETDDLVPLFNPRKDSWEEHFFWDGALLVGKTPVGRATIHVLNINDPIYVDQRDYLIKADLFPPDR